MDFRESMQEVANSSGRLWRFADYEFDELGRALRVKGQTVELESKPLDILLQLLLHAGEVVTREELLESAYTLASCSIDLGKLDEASALLQQIDVTPVTQLTGDPDWGADVTLAKAEIAYRRCDYDAARGFVQTITPVFTRNDAEPYQKRAFESLKAALDKPFAKK
jgi:ATP/maltotriose-dependent transcriptional regulator MalT